MEDVLGRLQKLVNKEIYAYDLTIKDFALQCGMSYTEMRSIANGQATDIRLSTVFKIIENSHIELYEIASDVGYDVEKVFNRLILLFDNTDKYSISVSKYR